MIIMAKISYSQIVGKITDKDGIPLPYATIYMEGTTSGTVSNAEGEYLLEIPTQGQYQLTFQYVGYKKHIENIVYEGKKKVVNVILVQDDNLLSELVITADAEDPAYAIIRKAIEKRPFYKNQYKSSQADLYIKGVIKLLDAPEALMGNELGNLGGILDTLRQGIIYLSESKSKYYFQAPDMTKEIMISSIKSGDNSLFTANQYNWASFDLYDEYIEIGRNLVSPIGKNALSHYIYKLESTFFDNNGYNVNKIKIQPKSGTSPALHGYIYITENLWNIYSTDIKIYGSPLRGTFIDTVLVKQIYVPVEKPDQWQLFNYNYSFKAGILGFKIGGDFTYVFSNWVNNSDVTKVFNNRESFRVEADALKKDIAFWAKTRPIPLTTEEQKDYIKKDSLRAIWTSKPFLDSLDRVNNKLKWSSIFLGYSYQNSHKKTSFLLPTPISSLRFNAVEGFKIYIAPQWSKEDSTYRKWTISAPLAYGFADDQFKASMRCEYKFDNYSLGKLYLDGGRQYENFDPEGSLIERNNSWLSLWNKVNYIRLYDNIYGYAGYSQEILNGIYINFQTGYTQRSPLNINTQFSLRRKDLLYDENIPNTSLDARVYENSTFWRTTLSLKWIPGQIYGSYPHVKIRQGSQYPTFQLTYRQGINLKSENDTWHTLSLKISDSYVSAKLWGYSQYNVDIGTFLGMRPEYFADYYHPSGNQILIPINPNLASFNLLPYFEYSTNQYYVQGNFRHHFNGKIADKIPYINRTKIKFVAGVSALYVPNRGAYFEPFIGIEGFSAGPVPLFDLDYSFSFDEYGFLRSGFTIRLSSIFNN